MTRRRVLALAAALAATAAGAALWRRAVPEVPVLPGLDDAAMAARFARPLPPPDHPLRPGPGTAMKASSAGVRR